MLAVGAVGAQAVQQHLNSLGHDVIELERGSLATRIWRDVKRKRVRIPDLCCTRCGVRIESREDERGLEYVALAQRRGASLALWNAGFGLDRFPDPIS